MSGVGDLGRDSFIGKVHDQSVNGEVLFEKRNEGKLAQRRIIWDVQADCRMCGVVRTWEDGSDKSDSLVNITIHLEKSFFSSHLSKVRVKNVIFSIPLRSYDEN